MKPLILACALGLIIPLLVTAATPPAKSSRRGNSGSLTDDMLSKLDLNADQKAKIKVITDNAAADLEKFKTTRADELKAAREAHDTEKMKSILLPMIEKRKAVMDNIKSLLTDDQKSKLAKLMSGKQRSTTSFSVAKRCGSCSKSVPSSSSVGDTCPHCGVRWGFSIPGF
jgi:Spy/CpxP family protein refolding chaperone